MPEIASPNSNTTRDGTSRRPRAQECDSGRRTCRLALQQSEL